jgi:hypothetical protein
MLKMQKKTFFICLTQLFIAVSKTHFFINKNAKKMSTSWRTNSLKTFLTQLMVGVSKNNLRKKIYLSLDIIEIKTRFYY